MDSPDCQDPSRSRVSANASQELTTTRHEGVLEGPSQMGSAKPQPRNTAAPQAALRSSE